MKVLFAVNSESISDAIIKKYQKDYREILSYKNVYYFNAIQKEIQKDKSYDRIIISEDLEPFSNNNYESIDKFIFEKLDGISDEAHDTQGNEMSIILICSDRHTKASSFLVKLFGIGIYNALLGNDRSMEEVCRLINKPRTKKEAKMYYKIDTDDVNYRAESEDEVSELEIQNIISHFKRLGKNTEKYVSSFENIASQYTDEQLKIIINCLPMTVKAILEESSSKYQEIMSVNGGMVQGVRSTNAVTREDQKRTGLKIDIIENKLNQNKMNGPIVIPNSVKSTRSTTAKKVVAIPQNSQGSQTNKVENKLESEKNATKRVEPRKKVEQVEKLPNGKIVRRKVVQKADIDEGDMLLAKPVNKEPEKTVLSSKTKTVKPVRRAVAPEKKVSNNKEIDSFEELEDIELPDLDFVNDVIDDKNVGNNNSLDFEEINEFENIEPVKKRRGRPRKNHVEIENKPKGKRGRPRKNPIEEESIEEDELDLFADAEEQLQLDSLETEELLDFEDNTVENDDFEELMESDEETFDTEEVSEEIELPELDDLDDMDGLDDESDELAGITEESFDEFGDYDEYGEYETQTREDLQEDDIDELYKEDILSDEDTELDEFDDTDEIEDSSEDDFMLDFNEDEDLNSATEEVLSDFDEEDELLTDLDDEEDINLLSDFEEDSEDDLLSELDNDEDDVEMLSEFDDSDESEMLYQENDSNEDDLLEQESDFSTNSVYENSEEDFSYEEEGLPSIESPIDYSMSNLNSLMTKDKKIVTFLGSTKNGVSFLINNLAEIFASVGINTAILDMTKNKNSYYIYTQNEENLRKIAYTSIEKLQNGMAEGIKVKNNLTVYTALPNDGKDYSNAEPILSTLVQNHSLVLIDCDFDTNPSYFASAQEIYLVQSMDILTIQPLTAFLRDLKTQGVLEPEKVRVVINKELKVRGLTNKAIIGGMSFYNDPAMSFMTELFNKDIVKYCSIPFEEMAYSKYLEAMLNCKVSINGYSKNFLSKLRILGDMVYPLTSKPTYSPNTVQNYSQSNFSNSMNDTLSKMRKKY